MSVWLKPAHASRRMGVKGRGAAALLAELGVDVPPIANGWLPLPSALHPEAPGIVARLGSSEFFIEESGSAPRIAALEARLSAGVAGAYPVLREDTALVVGGPAATQALAQACNVDLASAEDGSIVMTLMIGVGVLVLPQRAADEARYRIWCDPSFGPYLQSELEEIITELSAGNSQ